jgi:hypothetical protein
LNPPKSVFTKRGIYLQRAEFVRLAENLLQLKEVWGGLADTSPCSDQHASDEEKRECDHCTPKPPPEDSDSEAEEDPLIRAGNTNRRGRKRMPAWDEDPYSRVPEKRHASCFDEISSKISQACPQEDIVISDEDLDIDGDETELLSYFIPSQTESYFMSIHPGPTEKTSMIMSYPIY